MLDAYVLGPPREEGDNQWALEGWVCVNFVRYWARIEGRGEKPDIQQFDTYNETDTHSQHITFVIPLPISRQSISRGIKSSDPSRRYWTSSIHRCGALSTGLYSSSEGIGEEVDRQGGSLITNSRRASS